MFSVQSSAADGGVAAYVEENKIPVAFLIMLLLQFVFIIVDRALYLRKNLVGKIIFQFITVIGMHIWLFFLVPSLSERLIIFPPLPDSVSHYPFIVGASTKKSRQLSIISSNAATSYCLLIKYVAVIRDEFWAIA